MENKQGLSDQAQPGPEKIADKVAESPEAAPGGSAQAPSLAQPEQLAALEAENQRLLAEKQEFYERLLRKQAEFENYRKRAQREKHEFIEHANAELIRALLPSLDGFERALKHRDADVPEAFYTGLELIYRELLEVLTRAGLSPVEAVGQAFDPHVHQAVESVETLGHRDQEILEELQRGYRLKHRLLRPAVVKVAVSPSEPSASTKSD